MGIFLGALDTNVLGPVLPLIARAFRAPLTWTAWTVTAYTVAYVASTVLAGAVGDRRGHRTVFAWGVAAFASASALAALARSLPVFLVARVLQGAGAGAVYPNAQAEGVAQFPAERRGAALGLFGAVFGLASIVGPNVGGALGQYVGWPAIFLLNIPIALALLAATPRLPGGARQGRALPDAAGGLSFAGFLACGLLALTVGGSGRWILLAAAALLLLGFRSRQRRAAHPFLDTQPLASASGRALMLAAALIGYDMAAAVFIPLLTQEKLGLTVLGSGVALMPAALTGAVFAAVGGVLVDRVGARTVLKVGLAAGIAGGVLLAWPHLTLLTFVAAMVVFGLATAFTMGAPLNRLALGLYREEQAGEALSLVAVFRAVGLAAGPVLLTLAEGFHRFTGMFASVAAASALALVLVGWLPEVGAGARAAARAR